jgi:hypothetical protein
LHAKSDKFTYFPDTRSPWSAKPADFVRAAETRRSPLAVRLYASLKPTLGQRLDRSPRKVGLWTVVDDVQLAYTPKGFARQATTCPQRSGSGSAWPRSHFVYGLPGGYCALPSQAGARGADRSSTPFRYAATGGMNGGTAGRVTTTGTNGTTIGIHVMLGGHAMERTTTPPVGTKPERRRGRSASRADEIKHECSESLPNAPTHHTAGVTC